MWLGKKNHVVVTTLRKSYTAVQLLRVLSAYQHTNMNTVIKCVYTLRSIDIYIPKYYLPTSII